MSTKFDTGIDLRNQRATGAADASSATDLTTLQQVQALLNGLAWKAPVRVATTTNGALSTAYANGQTVDGVTLTTGMRILLKDQTTGSENGVYTVNASGAPTRALDTDSQAELQNATVYVIAGTVNADKSFTQTTNDITPGTTAQTWVQQNAGQAYTAGNGLSLASGAFAVVAGAGIIADGTSTRIDPNYTGLAKRYAADVPATSAGASATITHNLGNQDHDVTLYFKSNGEIFNADVLLGVNADTITFGNAVSASTVRYFATA